MNDNCDCDSKLNKCTTITSSNCVKVLTEGFESCNLTDVLLEIKTSIEEVIGQPIDMTFDCEYIANQLVGQEYTLPNIFSVISDSFCSIVNDITNLETTVNAPVTYDLKCLAASLATTTPQVVQAIINALCILSSQVASISSQITNNLTTTIENTTAILLKSAITSCNGGYGITKTGNGANVSISFDALVPPASAFFVWDSTKLSSFDATGKGKVNTPYCGWFIMNGLNGTPNMLGYTPAGATSLPGIQGTLDSRVSSIVNSDADYATSIGDKKGKVKHGLNSTENGGHSHGVNDPGHTHQQNYRGTRSVSNGNTSAASDSLVGASTTYSPTGITINPSGAGHPHENRQPTFYGFWITRL